MPDTPVTKRFDISKMTEAEIKSLIETLDKEGYVPTAMSDFPPPHKWLHFWPKDDNASE